MSLLVNDSFNKEKPSRAEHDDDLLMKIISKRSFSLQSCSVLNTDLSQGRMSSIQVPGKTVKEDIGMTTEALAHRVTTSIASGSRI